MPPARLTGVSSSSMGDGLVLEGLPLRRQDDEPKRRDFLDETDSHGEFQGPWRINTLGPKKKKTTPASTTPASSSMPTGMVLPGCKQSVPQQPKLNILCMPLAEKMPLNKVETSSRPSSLSVRLPSLASRSPSRSLTSPSMMSPSMTSPRRTSGVTTRTPVDVNQRVIDKNDPSPALGRVSIGKGSADIPKIKVHHDCDPASLKTSSMNAKDEVFEERETEDLPLEVNGCPKPVLKKRLSRGSRGGSSSSSNSEHSSTEDNNNSVHIKPRQANYTLKQENRDRSVWRLSPPETNPRQESPYSPESQTGNMSEATQRLLERWQMGPPPRLSAASPALRLPTPVTLPGLAASKPHENTMSAPSLPSLSLYNPKRDRRLGLKIKRKYDMWRETVTSSMRLGPELLPPTHLPPVNQWGSEDVGGGEERTDPRVSGGGGISSSSSDSFHMRKEYGKNLERNWYNQMLEEEQKKATERHYKRLAASHSLDQGVDEFYRSFYSSGSDTEGGEEQEDEEDDMAAADRESKISYCASIDVHLSDESDSSSSDIELVVRDGELYERRVRHKGRRRYLRREARYRRLHAGQNAAFLQGGRAPEDKEEVYLSDTEIRAMRLRLRPDPEQENGYQEKCTLEQLKAEVMNALSRLGDAKGGKKGKKRGASRRRRRRKRMEDDRGYGAHHEDSLYERFLREYGHLLQGYQPPPRSDSDSDAEPPLDQTTGTHPQVADHGYSLPVIRRSTEHIHNRRAGDTAKSSHYSDLNLPHISTTHYGVSPFTRQGILIGDTYYAGGFTFDGVPQTDGLGARVSKRSRRPQLEKVLRKLNAEGSKLLQKTEEVDRVGPAPLSARRMSDPGVHGGRMLCQQKVIPDGTNYEEEALKVGPNKKTGTKKRKGRKKKGKKNTEENRRMKGSKATLYPGYGQKRESRPHSSRGKLEGEKEGAEMAGGGGGGARRRRTQSARWFRPHYDRPLTLRQLCEGYDFPAKEVKIQVAERRLQRQRMRQDRLRRRQDREQLEEDFRAERRRMVAEAKLEYLRHLEEARAAMKAESKDDTSKTGEDSDTKDWSEMRRNRRRQGASSRRALPPDYYKELLDRPTVSAGVSWGQAASAVPSRPPVELTEEEIKEEAEDMGELLFEMKNCRYIRWSKTQQRILDYIEQLEMEQYDVTEEDEQEQESEENHSVIDSNTDNQTEMKTGGNVTTECM